MSPRNRDSKSHLSWSFITSSHSAGKRSQKADCINSTRNCPHLPPAAMAPVPRATSTGDIFWIWPWAIQRKKGDKKWVATSKLNPRQTSELGEARRSAPGPHFSAWTTAMGSHGAHGCLQLHAQPTTPYQVEFKLKKDAPQGSTPFQALGTHAGKVTWCWKHRNLFPHHFFLYYT